jgi:hypothetical protein
VELRRGGGCAVRRLDFVGELFFGVVLFLLREGDRGDRLPLVGFSSLVESYASRSANAAEASTSRSPIITIGSESTIVFLDMLRRNASVSFGCSRTIRKRIPARVSIVLSFDALSPPSTPS